MPKPLMQPWSYSKLSCWEECPRKAKFQYLDKIKVLEKPYFEKGRKVHEAIESYLRSKKGLLSIPGVEPSREVMAEIVKYLPEGSHIEQSWGFDAKWGLLRDWFMPECDCRIKMDACALNPYDSECRVTDWKTGKVYPSHEEQAEVYAIAAFAFAKAMRYKITHVFVTHAYIESGEIVPRKYTKANFPKLKKKWAKRRDAMYSDTEFAPKPSNKCRWCDYKDDCDAGR